MKTQNDELSDLLQIWKAEPSTDTGFNRRVWSRIEAEEIQKNAIRNALFGWLRLLALPRFAVAAVAIAVFCGVFVGGLQARATQEERYLLSLNPFSSQSSHS